MKKFAIILLMGGVLLSGCNYLDIVRMSVIHRKTLIRILRQQRIICILVIQKCLIRE